MEKARFDIGEIKRNARLCGQRYYWRSVGAYALITLLMVGTMLLASAPVYGTLFALNADVYYGEAMLEYSQSFNSGNVQNAAAAAGSFLFFYLLMFAVSFFLIIPLGFGYYRFLVSSRECDTPVSTIFHPFKQRYMRSVGYGALMTLKLIGWTLLSYLAIIPGIVCITISEVGSNDNSALIAVAALLMVAGFVAMMAIIIRKSYQYEQGIFALAENPELTVDRAFEIGKALSKGYIGKLFLLDLSYFLWYILGSVSGGIGYFFIIPVPMAGKAEAYTFLKSVALANGSVAQNELPGLAPAAPAAPAVEPTAAAPAIEEHSDTEQNDGE